MSSAGLEWLIVFVFLLFVFGLTFAEALWLSKKNWAAFGKSLVFAVTTNVFGFSVGFFALFVVFLVIFMLVWDGAIKNYKYGDAGIIAALAFGALFFPLFLALCKRLFLRILKIQTGRAAWIFSFVSSVLLVVLSLGVPCLAGFLLFR